VNVELTMIFVIEFKLLDQSMIISLLYYALENKVKIVHRIFCILENKIFGNDKMIGKKQNNLKT
jgi:hypothetical protein